MRLLLKIVILSLLAVIAFSGGRYIQGNYHRWLAQLLPAPYTELIGLSRLDAIGHQPDFVPFSRLPPDLVNAVVAIEDRRFWQHWGVDPEATVRAALVNLQAGQVVQGGSTIDQQLVKNVWLNDQPTFDRKLTEAVFAVIIDWRLNKQDIMAYYLNTVYFGSNAYGIAAASHTYFGKPPQALTLAEAALLAGIPNAPSLLSPYVNPRAARNRQRIVLDAMADQGFIDSRQAMDAAVQPLRLENGTILQ
ncbi:MAG: transglycosylase domain-containing protein [Negativicutes bacterium]|nr:transglycosylase domain-containing protein [Negativicutes bacterium]